MCPRLEEVVFFHNINWLLRRNNTRIKTKWSLKINWYSVIPENLGDDFFFLKKGISIHFQSV